MQAEPRVLCIALNRFYYAPVAESVDALDLKSNRGSPSVPVQVWPGAILKRLTGLVGLFYAIFLPVILIQLTLAPLIQDKTFL